MSALIFTGTTVLVGLSLLLIKPNWKLLKKAFDTLPAGQPKVIWQFGEIKDKRLYKKYESILALYLGLGFFALSILAALGSMICIFNQMLGIVGADPTTDFNVGKYSFSASILLFFLGMVAVGIAHMWEFLDAKEGKPSSLTGRLEASVSQTPASGENQSNKG